MMLLARYLKDTGTSQKTFAALAGVDQSVVSRLARQQIQPGLDLAFRIEKLTDGAVPAASWVSCEKPQEAAE